jgi:CRISPR-associated protein (TIGR02584 family)
MTEPMNNRKEPHVHPRRILLMVTGRTPQVVTETLYALSVKRDPPFIPTEVHLVTTAEGAQDARLALLAPEAGRFHGLCNDYSLSGIGFTPEQIHLIRDTDGRPVEDIRSKAEHEACADLITEQVRAFTADDNAALHVSLAGGRKTMTYYLGNALTLFGRPQDRLSHVLVPPPFESNPEFFYPTAYDRPLYSNRLERWLDAKDAEVTLADIPFVRLRNSLPSRFKNLEEGQASFTEVVSAMQQAFEPPAVTVDFREKGLYLADGRFVALSGADLAFYAWLARRALNRTPAVRIPSKDRRRWKPAEREEYATYLNEYNAEAERTDLRDGTGIELRAAGAMTYQFFHQRKSSIRECLEEAVGPLAEAYAIKAIEAGRPAGYGLDITPERIEIAGEGYL